MNERSENVVLPTDGDEVCSRCKGTKLVTIEYEWRGVVMDADDQPCPQCCGDEELPPHVERAIASEGGQGG